MQGSNSSDNKNSVRMVRCPQCGQPSVFAATNLARPFCSERCKLIDLGQWADESYRVPSQEEMALDLDLDAVEEQNSD